MNRGDLANSRNGLAHSVTPAPSQVFGGCEEFNAAIHGAIENEAPGRM
jgi:hypothetical protein